MYQSNSRYVKILTTINLKERFYRIEISEEDKFKTTFEFNGQVYE